MPNNHLNIAQLSFWERQNYFEDLDFLIIGAGIVGCSTAIHLKEKYPDAKVLVVERSYLPSGASTKNAGFACFGSPTELLDDLSNMSETEVLTTVENRWRGLMHLRELIGDKTLEFEQHGSWEIIHQRKMGQVDEIRNQLEYLNQKLFEITGEKSVYSEDITAVENFGFQQIQTTFKNRLEGQIHTGKMMIRFHQLLAEKGIHLLTGIDVETIENQGNLVRTNIGEIKTKSTFITVNGFAQKFGIQDTKPARAQVLVTSEIPNLKIKGTFHYDEGYYYFRNVGNRILLGGGRNLDFEGETTTEMTVTPKITDSLTSLLKEVILPNQPFQIDYHWSGIMGIGSTKKPIIKKLDHSLYAGVRLGGMGVAIGTNVGKELAEML